MRVLVAHHRAGAQLDHVAAGLAVRGHEVLFVHSTGSVDLPGVEAIRVKPHRQASPSTHPYLQRLESSVLMGQAVWRAADALVKVGRRPDLAYAHAGFGCGLYLRDALPGVPLAGHVEWLHGRDLVDSTSLPETRPSVDDRLRAHTENAGLLAELLAFDLAFVPTAFQAARLPAGLADRLEVLHEGVDLGLLGGEAETPADLRALLALLPADAEIMTYTARGLEPHRGFPQLMAALARLLPARPHLHALVVGEDRSFYGPRAPGGVSWKAWALDTYPELRSPRLRFLEPLAPASYRALLRTSHAHVYLTVPFVLSWSLLEAMASGCPIVASATAPVLEVASDGVEALLRPLTEPEAIAEGVTRLLDDRVMAASLGAAARARIARDYDRATLLDRRIVRLEELACAVRA